ncbi:hypothetical protein A3J19_03030 [Candidatus Daviesbacteria bacterium RIFCSPLOWO2_02_FULL_41_8]|uniref:Uncharacterized protein n=2 Tax=Candidatus Daviesiibacteriota TaxID=1752718 RepID=A0A1F5NM81_9BACT|nr:MAG: hypothetical protein A2871_03890 [Candidatus Daviesbacteria bacterium RIFCSPHIGHO2_01_FULL_41_23]OGE62317.1 MAG: hypothetical protein A2967_02580 [Candidatus Daviesbacteria bacterium RIFCSPLOWO2_01_FULL_41_32]OGE78738.1 MAG: hypothetical protein A3J19_03030 [Candidatus Daviesbacteria bacterium RIFCSPLOWO2_02_FULL_41_8]
MLIRTTIRINENLKKIAELKALREDLTLQDIFNSALKHYLESEAKTEAKKIVFKTHNLGTPLDNLKRADYYPNP